MGSLLTGFWVPLSMWPGTGFRGSPWKAGIGPRVEPSHVLQPLAQPFENQKQAWGGSWTELGHEATMGGVLERREFKVLLDMNSVTLTLTPT